FPLVHKADGLAAGKGVVIDKDKEQAEDFVHNTMENEIFSNAGTGLVIEEFLQGWEVSLFAFTDGVNFKTTLFSQDHKQAYDHDQGPNTGGMGAYAPVPEAEYYRQEIESKIIDPVLAALREEGCPYEGILYAGLMITKDGAKVIEFNCRFGDPETQVVLPLLETDFLDVCQAINNHKIDKLELKWKDSSCVCVVLASQGYPGTYEKGNEISIPVDIETRIIYAGVGNNQDKLLSTGGRVLGVLGLGPELEEAIHDAYQNVSKVFFRGMTFRKDIGRRTNKLYKVD
ncbi:MAG: phosphoribosylamine--glycine ligase, partial [Candidatus Cloacimonetes bacterium]|nr:phosphoribosylamine--glycine ligase [Candidatus Cloacimonadota bacterium]